MEMLLVAQRCAGTLGTAFTVAACHLFGPTEDTLPADSPSPTVPDRPIAPEDRAANALYRTAMRTKGRRIIVSIEDRALWLMEGDKVLFKAPAAVGKGTDFEYNGKRYRFETPRGQRRVQKKEANPIWTVPEWHYYEKAAARGLEAVHLRPDDRVELSDGSVLAVQGDQVVFINRFGKELEWPPGGELVFDGKIFIPPLNTAQRRVPDALGPYKLDTGDGYLIHGTHEYNSDSIGQAVSHGCIRLRNSDLIQLYPLVKVGTPVYIY